MKIIKLILKNFAAVSNAMDTNKITIDFTNAENKICLLIGPNGSGKTTILGFLNPFADVGNLDVRNGNHLILEDEEGYKEIHIQKDESLYIIKHFYTPHKGKSHSVKSYIEKDGKELNPNGNVSSFKEWVSLELNIEPEYLKLIRLGSNVTSLIDLSSTERKNFMSKIMDDIGVYLDYYKSVGTKQRQLNEMISHSVDKMNKLGILDKEGYKKDIKDKEKYSEKTHDELLKVNSELGILRDRLSKVEDLSNLKENIHKVGKKFEKMENILSKKDSLESTDVEFYKTKINDYNSIVVQRTANIEACNLILKNLLEQKDSNMERLRNLEIQLQKESNINSEIDALHNNLKSIEDKIKELEDNLQGFEAKISSDELQRFTAFLKNSQDILNTTYEFGKRPIEKIIDLLKQRKDVRKYINNHIQRMDNNKSEYNSYMVSKLYSLLFTSNNKKIIINCKDECIAKNVFNQLQNMIEADNSNDKNESIDFYNQMDLAYQNIVLVLQRSTDFKDIIDNLPKELKKSFELTSVYNTISNLGLIYDEKKFNDFYSLTMEYETYFNLLKEADRLHDEIKKFSSMSNQSSLSKEYKEIEDDIKKINDKIFNAKSSISDSKEELTEANKSIEVYSDIIETLESYDEIKTRYNKLLEDSKLVEELTSNISQLDMSYTRLNITYDSLQKEIQSLKSNLDQYNDLNKELTKMNELYDDLTFIKEALSSKEGIPLYIIQRYLDNTENITNELLDIAYDGKIFLDKFNITPSEFSIPFYNKGIRLEDVKYASQGELSFLSIALSFALASQTLAKYNIMLLDEIDGPLDTTNRAKFIMILENQIERINSEQNFLITHNDMFSSYPVDIIDLSFKNNQDDYPMANFIKIKRD